MKQTWIIIFVFLSIQVFAKQISFTFNITDVNGKSLSDAIVIIEKFNPNKKSYARHELMTVYLKYNKKTNVLNETLKIDEIFIKHTPVLITIYGPTSDFYKPYYIENIILTDKAVFDIKMEFDSIAFHNRQCPGYIGIIRNLDSLNLGHLRKYFDQIYPITFFEEDFSSKDSGFVDFSFDVTDNCQLINRKILSTVNGHRTDVVNQYLNAVQEKLKKSNEKCITIQNLKTGWYFRTRKNSR